jgi:hypothetical protein
MGNKHRRQNAGVKIQETGVRRLGSSRLKVRMLRRNDPTTPRRKDSMTLRPYDGSCPINAMNPINSFLM